MGSLIKFKSKGPSTTDTGSTSTDNKIVDSGDIGSLKYEVYQRGNIHIFNRGDRTIVFKKDCNLFEDALHAIDFDKMKDGDINMIKGAGDTADLKFLICKGEVTLYLNKKGIAMVETLRKIINIGKKSKGSK